MSIFRDLLTIKSLRESKAERIVRRQREVLAQASTLRAQANDRLERFVVFARNEEETLYLDLCSRVVRLRDIENVQNTVAHLRQQEQQHQETLRKAEVQRVLESEQLTADKNLRECERKEDAEMEEVAETRRDREDWDESADAEPPTFEAAT